MSSLLKRDITLLPSEKGLEDLYHTTDVCLVGIHHLKGLPKGGRHLDTSERLSNALLNIVKHPSDDGGV